MPSTFLAKSITARRAVLWEALALHAALLSSSLDLAALISARRAPSLSFIRSSSSRPSCSCLLALVTAACLLLISFCLAFLFARDVCISFVSLLCGVSLLAVSLSISCFLCGYIPVRVCTCMDKHVCTHTHKSTMIIHDTTCVRTHSTLYLSLSLYLSIYLSLSLSLCLSLSLSLYLSLSRSISLCVYLSLSLSISLSLSHASNSRARMHTKLALVV